MCQWWRCTIVGGVLVINVEEKRCGIVGVYQLIVTRAKETKLKI